MTKKDLIDIVAAKEGVNSTLCQKVIDATFLELAKDLGIGQGITIEGVGIFDAHENKTHKTPNLHKGSSSRDEDCSIFFHPASAIKNRVAKILKDEPPDQL